MEVAARSPPSQSPPPPPPPRVKHRRTRSGCLCCRLRKKKCDGQRPTCVACDRNSLICSWGPTPSKASSASASASASVSPAATAATSPSGASSTAASDGAPFRVTPSPPSSVGASPSPPPSSYFSSHSSSSSALTVQPAGLGFGLLSQTLMKPEHAFIYRNYVARTANTVSTLQNDANPFIRLLVPMATMDGVIRDAMLALSAVHLWKSPQPTAGAERLTSTYGTLAVRGLKYGLTRARMCNQVDTSLVVGALLLSLVEVRTLLSRFSVLSFALADLPPSLSPQAMKGESNYQTTLHLRGCSALLRQWVDTPQAAAAPELRAFVVELYLYLAISMGIPLGGSGAGSHVYIVQDAGELFPYVRAQAAQGPGPLLGCAHALFALIPRIYALAEACRGSDDGEDDATGAGRARAAALAPDEASQIYRTLVDALFAWQPPAGASRDSVLAARVYQQALLVFLLSSLQDCLDACAVDTAAVVNQAFAVAGAALGTLAPDAPIATTLTWPLAVLGSTSRAAGHQAIVRGRLRHLRQTLHWAVFDQVLRVLEALWVDDGLWQEPTRPPGMEGFEEVMRRLNLHVLIS